MQLTPQKLSAEHKNCTGADGTSSGQKTRGCIEGEDPAAVVGCKIPRVTGAGITVHTNPCERLSVRVAVARVALRQCCAYAVCVTHCL